MTFTWDELVMIGIIEKLGDLELVIYFMKILKEIKNKYLLEESRKFHCSLRVTKEDRWKKTKELKEKGLYHMMSSMVPITCSIPFTNSEWKKSSKYLKEILYFRQGFMMKREEQESGISIRKNQLVSEKIRCLNRYMKYYTYISKNEFDEALFDFMIFNDEDDDDYPYIMLDYDYDAQLPSIEIIG